MEKPMGHIRYMWENSLKQILDYIEVMEKNTDYLKEEIEGYSLSRSYDTYLVKKSVKKLYLVHCVLFYHLHPDADHLPQMQ